MKSKIVKIVSNIISPIASAMSVENIQFLSIPIVCSVITEISAYYDDQSTEKRLKAMEDLLKEANVSLAEFSEKLQSMNEHNKYVVRNNLKHLCLSALPETVDALNRALIYFIMSESQEMPETVCEIIRQLNANDILFLKHIKEHIISGKRETYNKYKNDVKTQVNTEAKRDLNSLVDRNVIYSEYTIFWNDIAVRVKSDNMVKPRILSLEEYLNYHICDQDGKDLYLNAFWGQSLLKLQSLGMLQTDFKMTLGASTPNNIDRFHITVIGQELLLYIKIDETEDKLNGN